MQDMFAIKKGRKIGGQSLRLSNLHDAHVRRELTAAAVTGSRRVPCPAGSLLLWDSRTIHQGWAGGPRLAMPVCWEPRVRRERDRDALRRKIFMCAAGVPSSHSSCEGRVHGMAPRWCPEQSRGGLSAPIMRSQLVPYSVASHKVKAWEAAQEVLWAGSGDPRQNADIADIDALSCLLKAEILNSL